MWLHFQMIHDVSWFKEVRLSFQRLMAFLLNFYLSSFPPRKAELFSFSWKIVFRSPPFCTQLRPKKPFYLFLDMKAQVNYSIVVLQNHAKSSALGQKRPIIVISCFSIFYAVIYIHMHGFGHLWPNLYNMRKTLIYMYLYSPKQYRNNKKLSRAFLVFDHLNRLV